MEGLNRGNCAPSARYGREPQSKVAEGTHVFPCNVRHAYLGGAHGTCHARAARGYQRWFSRDLWRARTFSQVLHSAYIQNAGKRTSSRVLYGAYIRHFGNRVESDDVSPLESYTSIDSVHIERRIFTIAEALAAPDAPSAPNAMYAPYKTRHSVQNLAFWMYAPYKSRYSVRRLQRIRRGRAGGTHAIRPSSHVNNGLTGTFIFSCESAQHQQKEYAKRFRNTDDLARPCETQRMQQGRSPFGLRPCSLSPRDHLSPRAIEQPPLQSWSQPSVQEHSEQCGARHSQFPTRDTPPPSSAPPISLPSPREPRTEGGGQRSGRRKHTTSSGCVSKEQGS